ncbi:hypothetical protein E0H26_26425 [Micromonospora zingiberis]|uniref:Uncharacterized protein n=2 Tax=Micromonospora zingiberis TaxID=2053011 RepID=A0A4R0G755_9ACTN|nr:hypothetical protein E0H26_26425 [Micromonospora zingiberis]
MPREPITAEQIKSWQDTLDRGDLREHERHGLEKAIGAAYLVSGDRGLQRLYADPRQLQDVANTFEFADWAAKRYGNDPQLLSYPTEYSHYEADSPELTQLSPVSPVIQPEGPAQTRTANPGVYTPEQQQGMMAGGWPLPLAPSHQQQEAMPSGVSISAQADAYDQSEVITPGPWTANRGVHPFQQQQATLRDPWVPPPAPIHQRREAMTSGVSISAQADTYETSGPWTSQAHDHLQQEAIPAVPPQTRAERGSRGDRAHAANQPSLHGIPRRPVAGSRQQPTGAIPSGPVRGQSQGQGQSQGRKK